MDLLAPFTGQLWKVATGGAALVALVLSALLLSSYFENRNLVTQRNTLTASINDPKTGYIAQLAQARTNVETLKVEVASQNAAYTKLSADSQARLAASEKQLAAAQAQTRAMEKKVDGFLATEPQGATLEDRIQDIDNRALQELLQ